MKKFLSRLAAVLFAALFFVISNSAQIACAKPVEDEPFVLYYANTLRLFRVNILFINKYRRNSENSTNWTDMITVKSARKFRQIAELTPVGRYKQMLENIAKNESAELIRQDNKNLIITYLIMYADDNENKCVFDYVTLKIKNGFSRFYTYEWRHKYTCDKNFEAIEELASEIRKMDSVYTARVWHAKIPKIVKGYYIRNPEEADSEDAPFIYAVPEI